MYFLLKKILFLLESEWAHEMALDSGILTTFVPGLTQLIKTCCSCNDSKLEVNLNGLIFPNPVGLAAGYDKDGKALKLLQAFGFGFLEVGTVTPVPQYGNIRPRIYRLTEDKAIINRMGFNNRGIENLIYNLGKSSRNIPVGVNIGKNRSTPISKALDDYLIGITKAWLVADYFTLNISSPNTKDLVDLQRKNNLGPFLKKIIQKKEELKNKTKTDKQIWLKISPDLEEDALKELIEIVMNEGVDALVVTNTTVSRNKVTDSNKSQAGGLSGRPLFDISNRTLKNVYRMTKGTLPLIGVGGIFSADNAYQKILLGASLVQIYTGLIFEGPLLIKKINQGLCRKVIQENKKNITELTGLIL